MPAARILFLPYPSSSGTWGSTMKLAAIAEECRARGDRTVFHACEPTAQALADRGFEVLRFQGAPPADLNRPIDSFYDVCAALGFDREEFWVRLLDEEASAIAHVRPDVIVSHMRPTAPVSAARHEIPVASCASWCTDPGALPPGTYKLDELGRRLGARGGLAVGTLAELVSARSDLQLATSVPEFEPELAGMARLVYTGYLNDRAPRPGGEWHRPVPPRLILAYTSSAPWGVDRVIAALARAAERAGAVLWCVTRAGGRSGQLSRHCELFSYLPFEALMPRASAVVFHGGQATALGTLRYGLPALAVPGRHYERRYNAARLAELGTGIHGEPASLRPSAAGRTMERLLDDGDMRRACQGARHMFDGYGGVPAAADAIHQLIDGY